MLAHEFMIPLDVSMEMWQFLELVHQLCASIKHAYLGLASIECTMARRWLKIVCDWV